MSHYRTESVNSITEADHRQLAQRTGNGVEGNGDLSQDDRRESVFPMDHFGSIVPGGIGSGGLHGGASSSKGRLDDRDDRERSRSESNPILAGHERPAVLSGVLAAFWKVAQFMCICEPIDLVVRYIPPSSPPYSLLPPPSVVMFLFFDFWQEEIYTIDSDAQCYMEDLYKQ